MPASTFQPNESKTLVFVEKQKNASNCGWEKEEKKKKDTNRNIRNQAEKCDSSSARSNSRNLFRCFRGLCFTFLVYFIGIVAAAAATNKCSLWIYIQSENRRFLRVKQKRKNATNERTINRDCVLVKKHQWESVLLCVAIVAGSGYEWGSMKL